MAEETALACNRFSTLALDIQAASFAEGALLQQYGLNAGGNQRWRVVDLGLPAEVHGVPGATALTSPQVQIVASHSGMALTPHVNGTQVVQFGRIEVPAITASLGQIWHRVPLGDGQYVLRNKRQGTVLGLQTASTPTGVEADLRPYAAADATQRWDLPFKLAATSTAYRVGMILSLRSKKVLDVRVLDPADEAVVQQSTYNGAPNQRFSFVRDGIRARRSPPNTRASSSRSASTTGRGRRWYSDGRCRDATRCGTCALRTALGFSVADPYAVGSSFALDVPGGSQQEGLPLKVYFARHGGVDPLWLVWVYR